MPARDLIALPKVDLHVHLEGAMRATTLADLAAKHGRTLPPGLRDGRYTFRDFAHFIDQWVEAITCLHDPEDFERLAREFCEDEAAQGVRYAEPSLSLPEHVANGAPGEEIVDAVLRGLAEGERETGVRAAVIIDLIRGFPMELSEGGLDAAIRHMDRGVVAVGIGGKERNRPEPYRELFEQAAAAGLHRVAHGGESAGAESVRGAVEALGAERVGHGVRILEDDSVVELVRDRRIPLEVCPTSNVMTGVVSSIEHHPLPALLAEGLVVTLNSDDPAMFDSPLAGEYHVAREVFGMDDESLADLARAGIRASFAPPELKDRLEADVGEWLADSGP
jgi:adenosine deaminase